MNNDQSEAAQWIDREIGPYRVRRLLGEGAFGAVYEAVKQPLGKRVALKLLHRRWSSDAHITARFLQEARAAASLRHPHIVDVDDVGSFDGAPWIAMEYLEGESLAERLHRGGAMSVAQAIELMLPVFSAVAAIHEVGIIHRDLKLENVQLWVGSAGVEHPKLLDFGIAKVAASSQDLALTGATDVMGTPEYMAPEQWRSAKHVDPASDQWALAVMLYRLLTDVSPFEGDSPQSVMFRVSVEPPPAFTGALAAEGALEATLRRALEKEPQNRFSSVRAFGAALLPLASEGTRQRWRAEFDRAGEGGATPRARAALSSSATVVERQRAHASQDSLVATSAAVPIVRSRRPTLLAGVAAVALAALGAVVLSRPRASSAPLSAQPTRAADASATPSLAREMTPQRAAAPVVRPAVVAPEAPSPTAPVASAPLPRSTARTTARPRRAPVSEARSSSSVTTLATPNI
ncbi:MAG: protein kinase [Polyangiales bacterium]